MRDAFAARQAAASASTARAPARAARRATITRATATAERTESDDEGNGRGHSVSSVDLGKLPFGGAHESVKFESRRPARYRCRRTFGGRGELGGGRQSYDPAQHHKPS